MEQCVINIESETYSRLAYMIKLCDFFLLLVTLTLYQSSEPCMLHLAVTVITTRCRLHGCVSRV